MAHSKQFHNVGGQKSIDKSYFFEEKFLLATVKDMQHFLDNHCFDISLSSIGDLDNDIICCYRSVYTVTF